MGKVLFAIAFLIIGIATGFTGGALVGVGGGAGIGIATGLSAGACGVAKAAQDQGLLTAEQVDRIFNRAIGNLRALSPAVEQDAMQISGGAGECDSVLERLRQAATN